MDGVRIGVAAVAAFALAAGSSIAQERFGGLDWGLLKTPDFAGDYVRGYEQGQRLAADRAAAQAAQAKAGAETAQRAVDAERAARERLEGLDRAREAGRLIAAGRCPDARAYALGEGDLDLATRVTVFCAGK